MEEPSLPLQSTVGVTLTYSHLCFYLLQVRNVRVAVQGYARDACTAVYKAQTTARETSATVDRMLTFVRWETYKLRSIRRVLFCTGAER